MRHYLAGYLIPGFMSLSAVGIMQTNLELTELHARQPGCTHLAILADNVEDDVSHASSTLVAATALAWLLIPGFFHPFLAFPLGIASSVMTCVCPDAFVAALRRAGLRCSGRYRRWSGSRTVLGTTVYIWIVFWMLVVFAMRWSAQAVVDGIAEEYDDTAISDDCAFVDPGFQGDPDEEYLITDIRTIFAMTGTDLESSAFIMIFAQMIVRQSVAAGLTVV